MTSKFFYNENDNFLLNTKFEKRSNVIPNFYFALKMPRLSICAPKLFDERIVNVCLLCVFMHA